MTNLTVQYEDWSLQAYPPRVTIHGESVKGPYEEILDERKFGAKKICQVSHLCLITGTVLSKNILAF